MRKLWSGMPANHPGGRYPAFEGVTMQPPVRHVVLDIVGPYEGRDDQIRRIAGEVVPLVADLR